MPATKLYCKNKRLNGMCTRISKLLFSDYTFEITKKSLFGPVPFTMQLCKLEMNSIANTANCIATLIFFAGMKFSKAFTHFIRRYKPNYSAKAFDVYLQKHNQLICN